MRHGCTTSTPHQKEVDGLERTQRTVDKKVQNCFVGKQSDVHGFLGCERGHMAGIPSQGRNH